MSAGPQMFDVPVAGGRLRVASWEAGGPVVLAAHGLTSSHVFWTEIAAQLGGVCTLVAPDLRGRGASNRLPGPYGMDAHASDLLAVLDHFDCDRAVLVGHSMGGAAAVRLAIEQPERVAALVLVDGGFPFRPGHEGGTDEDLLALLGPSIERLRKTFSTRGACRELWRQNAAFRAGDVDPALLDAYADYDVEGEPPVLRSRAATEAVREDWRDMHKLPPSATGPRIACPTMLVRAARGVQDEPRALYSEEAARQIEGYVPQLRDECVAGTNHMTIGMAPRGAAIVAKRMSQAAIVAGLLPQAAGGGRPHMAQPPNRT
jgi:lipase